MATLDLQIPAGSSDAQEAGGTVVINGSTSGNDLDALTDYVGMRFASVTIPQGETINEAHVTVQPTGGTLDEPDILIYGEAHDNPGVFTTGANNISARALTTANVAWSNTDLGANGSTDFNTPDIKSIIQEIVDRPGWASGNSLVIIFKGNNAGGTRDLTFKMFEGAGGPSVAARLHIDYGVVTATGHINIPLLGVG